MSRGIPSWVVFEVEPLTAYGNGCSTRFQNGQKAKTKTCILFFGQQAPPEMVAKSRDRKEL